MTKEQKKNNSSNPTLQESYDMICEYYKHLKDGIREYINEHADENGILILEDSDEADSDEAMRPYVITTKEHDFAPDAYTESRCVALRVQDDDVEFCAIPSRLYRARHKYESSVLSNNDNALLWYTLDWDCSNPFQYNIERIAYYITENQ